jgi:hypothetical protein
VLVAGRVRGINCLHRLPRMMREEVRSPAAFRRIGCTAETAPVLDHEALLDESPITMELSRLPAKLLVVRYYI